MNNLQNKPLAAAAQGEIGISPKDSGDANRHSLITENLKLKGEIGALTELFDSIIPTIEKQALTLGLVLHKPRRDSSVYAGFIVGMDRHRMLIKYCQQRATCLDFSELPELLRRPRLGDQLRVTFRHGALSLTIIPSSRQR